MLSISATSVAIIIHKNLFISTFFVVLLVVEKTTLLYYPEQTLATAVFFVCPAQMILHQDSCTTETVNSCIEHEHRKFTFLFNECLRTEHAPDDWKTGTITQIPKLSSVSTDPGDWRPVSVLPLPNKILERIVYNQNYTTLRVTVCCLEINMDSEKE